MFLWIHQLLNPHCEHCAQERREKIALEREKLEREREDQKEYRVCESCETLREQLRIANHEKEVLLAKLIKEPEPVVHTGPAQISKPSMIPWRVRQQMLQGEDRKRAELLAKAAKPDSQNSTPQTTEDLEKELDVVETEREQKANV